jgi:hypothetical protein
LTSSATTTSPDRQLLERRLRDAQDLDQGAARRLAAEILAAPTDVRAAAIQWARTGEYPDAPEVAGFTPLQLAVDLAPSQVFTALTLLRVNPSVGLDVLAHGADARGQAPSADWELIEEAPRQMRATYHPKRWGMRLQASDGATIIEVLAAIVVVAAVVWAVAAGRVVTAATVATAVTVALLFIDLRLRTSRADRPRR